MAKRQLTKKGREAISRAQKRRHARTRKQKRVTGRFVKAMRRKHESEANAEDRAFLRNPFYICSPSVTSERE